MAGILGSHFIARRVTVVGQVDSIHINGLDVTVEDSELRDTVYYAHHFTQDNRPTHNDGIQIRPIQVTKSFTRTFSDNVWKANGQPVPIMPID